MKFALIILLLFCCAASFAQDTTYQTYSITHDTTVITTIPERIIHTGDSVVVVSDSSYNIYFIQQLYSTVDGAVTITIPLYDTIPAHDTTITSSTTHDTTVIIVAPRSIIIRASDQSKVYGNTFSFTNNGSQVSIVSGSLKAGDVITVDNATSSGASASAVAGSYTITLSSVTIMNGATNVTAGYSITYQPGTLSVTPRPITIKADDQGKAQGQNFVFTHNGTQVHVTSGTLASGDAITIDNAASTGGASNAAAGTYPITLSSVTINKGATNVTSSYAITYQAGTLTVAAAPLIITVAPRPQVKIYGSTFTFTGNGSQVQVISGGLATGDAITVDNAASSGASSSATVGSYAIALSSITITNGATNVTGNYTITYASGTMTVQAKPITVRANNQTKAQGSTFTFTNDGSQVSIVSGSLVSGHAITVDNAASSGAGSGAAAGSYAITLSSVTITSGATNVTSNYAVTYQAGTMTVSQPSNPGIMYGIFPAASDYGTNIFNRMDHAKYVGVPLFRYNYDYIQQSGTAPTFRVEDIVDYGLKASLTFNHVANAMQWPNNRTVDNNFPNTQQEITFYSSKLDSLLKSLPANKMPEVVHINNEEAHREYWSGTVQEYLTWMEACVQVGHANGVAVTNGGTTIGIVYAMLQWYIDLGKPADSIQFIKDAYGITGNATGPFATEQRQWYQALLAGFAVSDMDYVNVHWYEPARDNTTDIVTSKLIPLIINYIQSVTGKGVITTEMGVKNGNYGLAYEYFDQWKNAGCKYIIYYAGNSDQGAQSFDNSEAYKAWLLQ